MQMVIDVSERVYAAIKHFDFIRKGKPLPKGHWLKDRGSIYKCSNCRNILDFDGVNAGRGDANYCPNCGAKMEGET